MKPKIKYINHVVTNNGNTSDIINVVMAAYDSENDAQIERIARSLVGNNIYSTCRNIWAYLIDNVKYQADGETGLGEMIRTPARLLHDGTGDCKSYSLFTATVLRFLNIKHVFRFASYNSNPEATHVYIIAYDEQGDEVCIDAVAAVQINADFDDEKQYNFKCDMANGRTKISYLAGVGTNGIGAIDSDERYSIWTNNRSEQNITPGHAYLYVQYDLCLEIAQTSNSTNLSERYDMLGRYAAMLWAYDFVNGNDEELQRITAIIAMMIREGLFSNNATNPQARDDWFAMIVNEIERRYSNDMFSEISSKNADMLFFNEITENVIKDNVINNYDAEFAEIGAIDGFTPLSDALKKAGIYFIYMFIPDNELKNYPDVVARKRKTQILLFNVIHKVDIFHSSTTVRNLFRSGIIARTGIQPEDYLKKIRANNVRVGEPITLATIATIIAIITGLISLIKAIFPKSKIAEYDVKGGAADLQNELYYNPKSNNTTGSSILSSNSLYLGLALVASFFIFKKK